jgi:hypothetical protein
VATVVGGGTTNKGECDGSSTTEPRSGDGDRRGGEERGCRMQGQRPTDNRDDLERGPCAREEEGVGATTLGKCGDEWHRRCLGEGGGGAATGGGCRAGERHFRLGLWCEWWTCKASRRVLVVVVDHVFLPQFFSSLDVLASQLLSLDFNC